MTSKIRGLSALIVDAVTESSRLIERVQKETADKPFRILEAIPLISPAAEKIHALHDFGVSTTHGAIRIVAQVVGRTIDTAAKLAETSGQSADHTSGHERGE